MIDKVVTLDDNEKWGLSDETVQNNVKYYLGVKLDDNEEPTEESKIFMEEKEGEDVFLTEVEDKDVYNHLSAIFVSKYNDKADELLGN